MAPHLASSPFAIHNFLHWSTSSCAHVHRADYKTTTRYVVVTSNNKHLPLHISSFTHSLLPPVKNVPFLHPCSDKIHVSIFRYRFAELRVSKLNLCQIIYFWTANYKQKSYCQKYVYAHDYDGVHNFCKHSQLS